VCGVVGFSGGFDRNSLTAGLQSIAHRGPDDSGEWFDEDAAVGLGHVRLSILDLSPLGHQPMLSPDGEVVIAFNGEIFNFRELRADLIAQGHSFRGHSDTEVLLHLYLAHGEAMLPMLNGMFAFAIWDGRKRAMLLARDAMGVKPLYYAQVAQGVVFASELKALLPFPGLSRRVNPVALRDHLTYLWAPAPQTMMEGVYKLPPSAAMWVADGRIIRRWQWAAPVAAQPVRPISDADAIDAVRDAVRIAVQRQMVADVPVGAFLSGGLDSSAVVAFARQAAPDTRLQCFTIAMDAAGERNEGMVSDLPYAQRVAAHLDVDLHVVQAGPQMADELAHMVWHLDEPQGDPAPLNAMMISRLARQHGIKVLLSGAGGDDIFTGYRRHYALQAERWWGGLPQVVRAGVAAAALRLPTGTVLGRRLQKAFRYAGLDGDARIASYFYWLDPARVDSLLSEDMRRASARPDPLVASLAALAPDVPRLNRMLQLECQHFLADHNLNYTDKMSMESGVEVRVPLLDPDVVRLAFSLPLDVKQRGRQGKWVLTEAMRGILPDEVLNRPKTGFGVPLRSWLRGPLRTLLNDTLSPDAIRRRGLFCPIGVQQFLADDAAGRVDGAYPLFAMLCIELWCQRFVDGDGADYQGTR
jgi:asparagine synthase (glutamine-hydrolysing)